GGRFTLAQLVFVGPNADGSDSHGVSLSGWCAVADSGRSPCDGLESHRNGNGNVTKVMHI
ncbi:hypothetical protein, partial [Verminephrobacter aporrectodeae]|uniref:hypothetical protein n=1 Tax=Verminephrobacter aporrectodeae TaxID=1110389 RepID=UPI0022446217